MKRCIYAASYFIVPSGLSVYQAACLFVCLSAYLAIRQFARRSDLCRPEAPPSGLAGYLESADGEIQLAFVALSNNVNFGRVEGKDNEMTASLSF